MTKHASMSNCRYPEDHSKKDCVCGGHSQKDRKRQKRKPTRETIRRIMELQDRMWRQVRGYYD